MKKKKVLAIFLSIAVLICLIPNVNAVTTKAGSSFYITSPTYNQLVAAGYIDITWTEATSGTVKDYAVYINGSKDGTTKDTTYEYYTTDVVMNEVYVVAEYENGETQTTETSKFGVTKKGLGLSTDMGANLDLQAMNVGWYYNWGTTESMGEQYSGIEFVPMVWKETNANNLKNKINTFKNNGYKYALTFNEPDLGDQCNMSVDDVYNVWQGIDDVTGIKVSSPVTALWPKISTDWFQTFMSKIDTDNDHDVDFISIHCYPGDWAGAGMAEWFLTDIVDWTWETYQKPIWITEFSTSGNVTATGENGTKEFWEAVMPGLDSREYVERYAAFGFDSDTTGLWRYDTGELTPAGEVYAANGIPEDYNPAETPEPAIKTVISNKATQLFADTITINDNIYQDYAKGAYATASSALSNNIANNAIDEDLGSRWESNQGNDEEYITIDLGSVKNIKQVKIDWEAASAASYNLDVSVDGVNYTTLTMVRGTSGARVDTVTLRDSVQARYVRMTGLSRTTTYGYSIYDMAVYGAEEVKDNIGIVGYQISDTFGGGRTIAYVEPTIDGKTVKNWGLVYGIASIDNKLYLENDEDMVVDSDNPYVKSFESTSQGTVNKVMGDSTTATYYVRTMAFGAYNNNAFTAGYKVRAYALLEGGTYVYGDIEEYSVYDIADYMYQNNIMNTLNGHEYLFNNILSVVDSNYEQIEYNYGNSLVKPAF